MEDPRIGDLVALGDIDPESACLALHRLAAVVVVRLRRRYRLQDADVEDLAHDALVAAAKDGFAALRRANPSVPLAAWLTAVFKNILRKRGPRELQCEPHDLDVTAFVSQWPNPDVEVEVRSSVDARRVESLLSLLSPEQRRVEDAWLAAGTECGAAAALKVSRSHVHDVRRRARRRMRRGARWAGHGDRRWASSAASRAAGRGDDPNAALLRLYSDGRPQREIAEALGLTPDAVRGRIHRARTAAQCSP